MGIRRGPANQHGDQKYREGDVAHLKYSTRHFKHPCPSFSTTGSQNEECDSDDELYNGVLPLALLEVKTKNASRTTNCAAFATFFNCSGRSSSIYSHPVTLDPSYSHPIILEPHSRYYRAGSSYHGRSPHRQPSLALLQALCSTSPELTRIPCKIHCLGVEMEATGDLVRVDGTWTVYRWLTPQYQHPQAAHLHLPPKYLAMLAHHNLIKPTKRARLRPKQMFPPLTIIGTPF